MIIPYSTIVRRRRTISISAPIACSVLDHDIIHLRRVNLSGRSLLSDKRPFLSQFHPGTFCKRVFRVLFNSCAHTFSKFFQEQMLEERKNEDLVDKGILTPYLADRMNEEWEKEQWENIKKDLPRKILNSFLKTNAIIFVMRCYEWVAEQLVDEIKLDRLTLDSFYESKRVAQREHTPSQHRRDMTNVGLWSSGIMYLADYSVHQVIIGYVTYTFYQRKRRELREQNSARDDISLEGGVLLSFLKQSSTLLLSRSASWYCSSVGGAYGSVMIPGWGVFIGSSIGDSIGALVDQTWWNICCSRWIYSSNKLKATHP